MGKKNQWIKVYFISRGNYSYELVEQEKNARKQYKTLEQWLSVSPQEFLKMIGVPDEYHELFTHIFEIPQDFPLDSKDIKKIVEQLKSTMIMGEFYEKEELVEECIKKTTGHTISEIREIVSKIIENL